MSKTRFSIEVTAADIERATRNDSYTCVVAQAIARTIPDARNIDVDVQMIRFTIGGERLGFLTPYVVQGYVVAFDAGDEIHPFTFQLRDPKRLRRSVQTEAGRAIHNAKQRAQRAAAKDMHDKSSISSAAAAAESVRAAYDGEQKTRVTEGRKPPPRVFKKKRRSYGHRVLRINQ
jgi:hypothetical protein